MQTGNPRGENHKWKPITVIFEPDGRRIKTTSGTSIFEATCETGVGIRSECGGKGSVENAEFLSKTKTLWATNGS